MPSSPNRKVAISYAWKTESDGEHAGKVDALCKHLHELDVQVIRDVEGMKLGDRISDFMREIGTSDYLCVFLSEAYLSSPNCTYELLVAWESLKHKPADFTKRVKVWVMKGAKEPKGFLPDPDNPDRNAWITHWTKFWRDQRDRLVPDIKTLAGDGLDALHLEAFNRIKRFADSVNAILLTVQDTLCPVSIDELKDWATTEFPPPTPEEEARQVSDVYQHTVAAMDEILRDYPEVGKFLAQVCPTLVVMKGNARQLSDDVRTQQFDGRKHLKGFRDKLATFNGTPVDLDRLRQIAGGLAVLCVDRKWTLLQRRGWRAGEAAFPGTDGVQFFGGGRAANFLPLAAAALAQGCADLSRVFDGPDHRLIDDPALNTLGIGPDAEREYKLFFIRCVLKPGARNIQINENDDQIVDSYFKDVQETLEQAAEEEHDPYYATNPAHKTLQSLMRTDLRLDHLLLLMPGEKGSIRDAVAEPVHVFSYLHDIFQTIQRRLTNIKI